MSECNGSVMRDSSSRSVHDDRIFPFPELRRYRLHRRNVLLPEGPHPVQCKLSAMLSAVLCRRIECDISRYDISFKCSLCYFYRKRSCHDHLVSSSRRMPALLDAGISTVESHEGIFQCVIEFALDVFFIHISRYGVVDIQQCNCIVADTRFR